MTPDHVPSFASVLANEEMRLGRQLSPAEARALNNEANAIVVQTSDHQAYSRTYGGRNSPGQIAADAADPVGALQQDWQAWRQNLINSGHSAQDVDNAFQRLDDLNRLAGRDWNSP